MGVPNLRLSVAVGLLLTVVAVGLLFLAMPLQAQSEVPPKPTGLVAAASHDRVLLSWDNAKGDITGYQVFRRNKGTQKKGDFTLIGFTTGNAATTYTDADVEPETQYVYRVKAVNEHGVSKWSGYARANTPAAPKRQQDETVVNLPGVVQLTAMSPYSPDQPYVGVWLTATVQDGNTEEVIVRSWKWHRSVDRKNWKDIDKRGAQYTPTTFDELHYLRSTAVYTQEINGEIVEQTAYGVTDGWVKADISEPAGVDYYSCRTKGEHGFVRVDSSVTGAIDGDDPREIDYFVVNLVKGRKYRVAMEGVGTGQGTLSAPSVAGVYYFPEEDIVDGSRPDHEHGHDGVGQTSRSEFVAQQTREHCIYASKHRSTVDWGTYRLSVQEIYDDLGVWYTAATLRLWAGLSVPMKLQQETSMGEK